MSKIHEPGFTQNGHSLAGPEFIPATVLKLDEAGRKRAIRACEFSAAQHDVGIAAAGPTSTDDVPAGGNADELGDFAAV